jgi:hypothetical protein
MSQIYSSFLAHVRKARGHLPRAFALVVVEQGIRERPGSTAARSFGSRVTAVRPGFRAHSHRDVHDVVVTTARCPAGRARGRWGRPSTRLVLWSPRGGGPGRARRTWASTVVGTAKGDALIPGEQSPGVQGQGGAHAGPRALSAETTPRSMPSLWPAVPTAG